MLSEITKSDSCSDFYLSVLGVLAYSIFSASFHQCLIITILISRFSSLTRLATATEMFPFFVLNFLDFLLAVRAALLIINPASQQFTLYNLQLALIFTSFFHMSAFCNHHY
jgi:hypothetical protein